MLQVNFVSKWSLWDMFQIHIGLADFCRSGAEARAKPTAGPEYIYPRLGFTLSFSGKPPYGVVTQNS